MELPRNLSVIFEPGLPAENIRRMARIAVASGVRSLWLSDSNDDWRLLSRTDPWQVAAAIASDEQEMLVGVMFDTVWWPPGLIGSMGARLNAAMDGRLRMGITTQSESPAPRSSTKVPIRDEVADTLTYMQYAQQVREVISGAQSGPARRAPALSIRVTAPEQLATVVQFADTAVIPFTDLRTIGGVISSLWDGCRVRGRIRGSLSIAVEVPVVLGHDDILHVPTSVPASGPILQRDLFRTAGPWRAASTTESELRRLGVDEIRYWTRHTTEMADILPAIGDMRLP